LLTSACGTGSGRVATAFCPTEQAAFDRDAAAVQAASPGFERLAFTTASAPVAPASSTAPLAEQALSLSRLIDQEANSYAALRQCRAERARETALSAAQRDALRRADETAAHGLALAETIQATLNSAVDRLASSSPELRAKTRQISGSTRPPPQPFIALETVPILARPDPAAVKIADLRKGTRAQAPASAVSPAGWTVVLLNDGSLGYVATAALRPASLNPSAVGAGQTAAPHGSDADPVVALATAAKFTIPESVARLAAEIKAANEAAG
jgi:hypothetical protein